MLGHVAKLKAIDVDGVQPMTTPFTQVNRLDEDEPRYVLVADLARVPLSPLVDALLLPKTPESLPMWTASGWENRCVADALPPQVND